MFDGFCYGSLAGDEAEAAQQQAMRNRSHKQHLWLASAMVLELIPGKQCRDLKLEKVRVVVGLSIVVLWSGLTVPSSLNM